MEVFYYCSYQSIVLHIYKYGLSRITMDWKHHAWIGAVSAGAFALIMFIKYGWFDTSLITILELVFIVALSGLIPDLDHENGKLHQWLIGIGLLVALFGMGLAYGNITIIDYHIPIIFGVVLAASTFFAGEFSHHRGFWHSIPACIIYGGVIWLMTSSYQIGIVGLVGCYSHLVADSIPFKLH